MADYGIDINVNMGSAGGNFQTLIDSINNLNASFQKIGTAGDDAAKKHKQSFSDSMAIMSQYGNSVKQVETEISKLKKQIIESNSSLEKRTINEKQHKEAVDKLSTSLKQLQTAQRQYNNLLGQTASQSKAASSGVNGLTGSFNKLGAVLGISFGLYGIFRVLQDGIKTIAAFDLAQKKLRSVLGETAQGMEQITQSAISVGRSSIFGAKGVSELQIELAKMGFAKQEIMDMQQAIVNLATATQEDLASSAEVVANILRAYGLAASEATRVTDVMGKSFNDSALDLSNFREAIKYVAPVAKQAGFTLEETVAALELLSNAGIKGSLAGTGLNNVLKAMMDSNSKLSKELGGTVHGFDGFRSVLQKAKDEGWNMEKIFGVITQRATAAFTIFKNGTEELDKFREANMNAAGTMREQTAVQLESITFQAKLAKESFHALWLEMDKGDNVLSSALKGWMLLSRMMTTTSKMHDDMLVNIRDAQTDAAKYLKFIEDMNLGEDIRRQVQASINGFDEFETKLLQKNNAWYVSNEQRLLESLSKANSTFSSVIEEQAKKTASFYDVFLGKTGDSKTAYVQFVDSITKKMEPLDKSSLLWQSYSRALQMVADELENVNTANDDTTKDLDDQNKALKERYQFEIDMLKLQKQIAAEKIKLSTEGFMEQALLSDSAYEYDKKLLDLELEMHVALGENKIKAEKKYNAELEKLTLEHANRTQVIIEGINKESDSLVESILKTDSAETDKLLKDWVKEVMDKIFEEGKKLTEYDKWAKENPILNMIFGKGLKEDFLKGVIDIEQLDFFAESMQETFSIIGDNISQYADAWVEATDRIVDQLNRQIDETQAALDTEAELMAAGYANNVTLKRKELEELKKQRAEAFKDQRQAQQAQVALDTVTQISSMITASSHLFKALAPLGPLGVPLAVALIATMFTAFAAAKTMAMKTAGVNKFEEGGWIGGKRHSQGGTLIEAEHGEFMINRNSASKYRNLIEAVNDDNKLELNKIYLNGVKGQVLKAKVSLDDSEDLKAIRKALETKGKTVEYSNGYRIERIGNVTTRIKLSLN